MSGEATTLVIRDKDVTVAEVAKVEYEFSIYCMDAEY